MVDQSNAPNPIGNPSPPQSAFDARLVEVDIQLPTQTFTFPGSFAINASGSIFGCPIQNTCVLRINNLTSATRNEILTLASPLLSPPANNPAANIKLNPDGSRPPVIVTLKAGRQSSGLFVLYIGNVFSCEVTQPPDIGIVLRALNNNYQASLTYNIQLPATTQLSAIASAIATKSGLFLDFEATDKNISNFNSTTSNAYNIDNLSKLGNIHVGIDNDTLWVTDSNKARKNTGFLLDDSTGMIGVPQVTSEGVVVKMMLNSAIHIGGEITIDSKINPSANGTFKVMKIDYEIASRDQPFWFTLLCQNLLIYSGNSGT